MNLIIDVGNSFVKLAVFSGNKLKKNVVTKPESMIQEIKSLKRHYKSLNNAIISSVGNMNFGDLVIIEKEFDLMSLFCSMAFWCA